MMMIYNNTMGIVTVAAMRVGMIHPAINPLKIMLLAWRERCLWPATADSRLHNNKRVVSGSEKNVRAYGQDRKSVV